MKIYDIVNEANPGRIMGIASDLWKGITSIRSKSQLLTRLEPFIETSSTKYADAVINARSAGKAIDPNPYAVLKNDLDPNLTPEQLKVILDEVAKRAQPKIKAGKPAVAAPTKQSTPRATTEPSTPTVEVPPKEPKIRKPSRAPNDVIPRQKIGDVQATTMFQKAAGNLVNAVKYLGAADLGVEYWKEQGYVNSELAKGSITKEQADILTRENREITGTKLIALGLGIRLGRAIGQGTGAIAGTVSDFLTFGLASRDRAVVLAVLGSEVAATIFANQILKGDEADKFIAGLVQNVIDPSWEWAWNKTAGLTTLVNYDPKEWLVKSMKTAMQEAGQGQQAAPVQTTQSAATQSTAPAAGNVKQSGQPTTGNNEFDDLMKGAGLSR